jgi:hypothetical protein
LRTGWKTTAPESLFERNDILNNMLVETQTSSFYKHHFDESTYPRMLQMVKEIDNPKTLHDPDLQCALEDDEETTALAEIRVDSGAFEGEAFENSSV